MGVIAELVRTEMDRRGMAIADLSRRTGIHATTLSRYLNGHTHMTAENLEAVLAVFGFELVVREGEQEGEQ